MACQNCKSGQDRLSKLCRIIEKNDNDPSKLIPILHEVQREFRYLPEDVLAYIATALKLPPAKVYGVASFYSHFALEPKGKYVVHICDGTACHVKGSMNIYDALCEKLNVSEEKSTTEDMQFTVETVSCIGACGMAPVISINGKVYGQVTAEKAVEIIDELSAQEVANV
ncbi:NADP-reducing hydrogenase subunit HndA [Limihaloglobus sulfuriphilus]|uniref:NADP-reducing hydrogenase subunit HndA n=1 Tax=Limihaloglobus sulfuriphilus TaxID=1851148 RepID=A0A1Q2MG05_9BACT|nr:NAD(P)H-dependent oxidoreductase subunit E [Limihaloglobus sulfuriphilus]AQQ71610.1 NADP-reducing hydrogenase subunit HndA [Limihaloglobus sulfuriphilus]